MDAGGPSAKPVAEGKIEPVYRKRCVTEYQARQKMAYLNGVIEDERAAYKARVGPSKLFVYQHAAMMCVIHRSVSKLIQLGGPCAGGAQGG